MKQDALSCAGRRGKSVGGDGGGGWDGRVNQNEADLTVKLGKTSTRGYNDASQILQRLRIEIVKERL